MKCGAVILARMSSNRLAGKVLRDLAGIPLLGHVIRRARRIRAVDEVAVATSTERTDDPVARFASQQGVTLFRGALNDVAKRTLDCARTCGWDLVARVNADSPFLDPYLIDAGVRQAIEQNLDFVTNLCPRSYPYGVAVEVFRTTTFAAAYARMDQAEDFEHVTSYLYRNTHALRFANLKTKGVEHTDVRLAVDNEEDLLRAAAIIARLGPAWEEASLSDTVRAHEAVARDACPLDAVRV